MSKAEPTSINAHEDVALFREAVQFTAAESGFVPPLIEKDYLPTLRYGSSLIELVNDRMMT